MNEKFIVTNEYLSQRGLDLNDYALDGTLINAIIIASLDILVSRICKLDDSIKSENKLEEYLDSNDSERTSQEKINTFFKAQYHIIYNLIFQSETNPKDDMLDDIIVFELGLGKINGWQKGYYRKQGQEILL